jgi:hypothetical protein
MESFTHHHPRHEPRTWRTRAQKPGVPSTPEELKAALQRIADAPDQQACVRFIAKLLEPFPTDDCFRFWVQPRGSLRGRTPLQALADHQLRQLQDAAEAFADA